MDPKLRKVVLDRIKPSLEERKKRSDVLEVFVVELEKVAGNLGYDVEFFAGGSFGKGTDLSGSSDIDLFARFNLKYGDEKISGLLKKILKESKFDFEVLKGSRDYYQVEFVERKFYLKIEVVPVLRIDKLSDACNSTDMSPLHVEFLKKKALENRRLCDEIRLAKQFFKAKGLYGAESYIGGFSGHVLDILIAYYGSLEKLIDAACLWGKSCFIDIAGFYKSDKEALENIDDSKISNLIVVDPIMKERNAARALFEDNYFKFLVVARNFDKFRDEDFIVSKFSLFKTIKEARKFAKRVGMESLFYVFDLDKDIAIQDIVGSKLLKLSNKMLVSFEREGFKVFKKEFFIDFKQGKCLFVFVFENVEVPKLKKVLGPYVYMKQAFDNFVKVRDMYFIEGDRVYSYEMRKVTKLKQISVFSLDDCEKMLNRKLNHVKKIKVTG